MTPWFSPPVPDVNPRVRLLCCPCAGAGPGSYAAWRRDLTVYGIEVRALQLPGREARLAETPSRDLTALVAMISDEIAHLTDIPYVIFGHSMGALIAFELVRRLLTQGVALPSCLIVAGSNAPHLVRCEAPLHRIGDDRRFVDEVAREYAGIPAALMAHEELRLLLVPALRADLQLVESYMYVGSAPLPVPIAAYGGTLDPGVSEFGVTSWRRHTTAHFSSRLFVGDHFFVHAARADVLEDLRSRVAHLLALSPRHIK
jgi:surfactin synthase thioesterase subunit